jgi:hypothetical protein
LDENCGGDAGAAVRDHLPGWNLRQQLVPGRIACAGDVPGNGIDRFDIAAIALRDAGVEQDELVEAGLQLLGFDRVTTADAWCELLRLGLLLAGSQRSQPTVEVQDRALVVAEVA